MNHNEYSWKFYLEYIKQLIQSIANIEINNAVLL